MSQRTVGKALKATYAGVVTFLGQLVTVLTGSTTVDKLTQGQWSSIVLFTVVAVGGVYGLAGWTGPRVNGGQQ